MAHQVIHCIVNRHAAGDIEEPNAALPETQHQTLAPRDDKECTKHGPAEHAELVAVVSILERDNEQDDAEREYRKHGQTVILVAEAVNEGARLGRQSRLLQNGQGEPSLGD